VIAGAQAGGAPAVVNLPLGPGLARNVQLRQARFRPQHFDPQVHRNIVYADQPNDLAQEFYTFRRQNAQQDPLTTMTCSKYAKREEIGDHIQMCIESKAIHIVIYAKATLKGLEILAKKLRYHTKKMKKAVLSEHGAGVLFDQKQLQSTKPRDIAQKLQQLLNRRRSLRLVLEGSEPGGPMSKDWMHLVGALRRI
jgi:hypothetical protein